MSEWRSRGRAPARRVGLIVSRYNEAVTLKLLDGARRALDERGVVAEQTDVVWVSGTYELPAAAATAAATGRYAALVALGSVIRGETSHFDFIAGAAAHGLQQVSVTHRIPVAFGVLTTDDLTQALARAGGARGNKGFEAATAALDTADVLAQLTGASA